MRTIVAMCLVLCGGLSAAHAASVLTAPRPTLIISPVKIVPHVPIEERTKNVIGMYSIIRYAGGAEGSGNFGGACLFAQIGEPITCRSFADCQNRVQKTDEAICIGATTTDLGVRPGQCWFRPAPELLKANQSACDKKRPLIPNTMGSMRVPSRAFGPTPHRWRLQSCQSFRNFETEDQSDPPGTTAPACASGERGEDFRWYEPGPVLEVK